MKDKGSSLRGLRFSRATWLSAVFVLLTLVLLASPAAGPLRYGFPALAFIVAYFIFRESKPFYAGFVVWLWLLTPLMRRLIEYRAGGTAQLVIGTPFLVCALPFLLNLGSLGEMLSPEGYPVLFAGAGIAYGLGVGFLLHNPYIPVSLAFWSAPLFFAFFIVRFRSEFPQIRSSLEKAFLWGTLAISAYGIHQYLVLTPWDALWMETFAPVTFGLPEAQQLRVFSTMNSPQTLAGFLVAGIFIAMRARSRVKWLTIPLACFSLLLTQSRTSWVGLIAGLAYLVFFLPVRQKLQMAVFGVLSVILVLGALQGDQKNILAARLQTLTAPSEDGSFTIRMDGYAALLPKMIPNPYGAGVGLDESADQAATAGMGLADSGVISILFTLGIPGTMMYLIGVGSAVKIGFRSVPGTDPADLVAFRAILIAAAATIFALDVVEAPAGFVTWVALMICATQPIIATSTEAEPDGRETQPESLASGLGQRPAALDPSTS